MQYETNLKNYNNFKYAFSATALKHKSLTINCEGFKNNILQYLQKLHFFSFSSV